jgi:hypothetical protein
MVRKQCIGITHHIKAPNGMSMKVTIENDPSQFALYRLLKLDVFKSEVITPTKKVPDLNNMSLKDLRKYAKPFGITGKSKKDIIDAINKK